jgi:hypothetical protein
VPSSAAEGRAVQIFASMPVYVGGLIFVGGFVLLAVGAGLLAHRYLPQTVLEDHNDIAGFMFAVVGVVYAVVLAFLAIATWERFDAAEVRVHDEASQLIVVYRRVDAFPASAKSLRSQIARYADLVVKDEWPKMNSGGQSDEANRLIERIAYQVRHLQVKTASQQDLLTSLIDGLQATMMDRNARLLLGNTGLNGFLWTILFLGAAVTIVFSYLFAFRSVGAQIAMTGLLAFSLALVLYLIAVVDYPFRGDVRIQATPFIEAGQAFRQVGP